LEEAKESNQVYVSGVKYNSLAFEKNKKILYELGNMQEAKSRSPSKNHKS